MYIILLLIVLSTNVFGMFDWYQLPYLSVGGLGTLWLGDMIIIVGSIFFVLKYYTVKKRDIIFDSRFNKIFNLYIMLILFTSFRAIIENVALGHILNLLRPFSYLIIFYLTVLIINNKKKLNLFIKYIQIFSVFVAIVVFLQVFFNVEFEGSKTEFVAQNYSNLLRSYNIGLVLVSFSLMISSSILFSKGKKNIIFISIIIIMSISAILLSFARSAIIANFFGLIYLYYVYSKIDKDKKGMNKIYFISLIILIFIAVITVNIFQNDVIYFLGLRLGVTYDTISSNSGTFGYRVLLNTIKFNSVFHTNPFLGLGFKAVFSRNFDEKLLPYTLTADSSLSNLFILFGLIGIILFLLLFYFHIREIKTLLYNKRLNDKFISLLIGNLAFQYSIFVESFFGNRITTMFSISILSASWALTQVIKNLSISKEKTI